MRTYFIALAILLLSSSIRGQQQDGSVLERRVSLSLQKQTISSVLDQLSWQTGVYFSYNSKNVDADKKISIDASDKSLFTVLTRIFNPKEFKLKELENQIIILKNEEQAIAEHVKTDSIPVHYFFLKGKIVDSKRGDPVSYASISLFGKPFGTISNPDGDFIFKVHPDNIYDTLVISCMGYTPIQKPAYTLLDEDVIQMAPFSIRIREIKVTATTPPNLLKKIRENREKNYCLFPKLMTAFYRETVKQDNEYINVSEAVVEVLKAPYNQFFDNDEVRIIKGRRSPDVKPFQWLNFKLQGGPFTITMVDVVKTIESFIDEKTESFYKYNISKVVWYNDIPVYVLEFEPVDYSMNPVFKGELFVDRETFAIVHASFGLDKTGLKNAASTMIKKKPIGVSAKPSYVNYSINYKQYQGNWHFHTAQASVKFKVKSRQDNINSEFHSVSDILVTDIQPTQIKRFTKDSSFRQNDIFVEMIKDYDERFWENYNIIRPDEDLINAFKSMSVSK